MDKGKKKHISLVYQIILLFVVGVILIGLLTSRVLYGAAYVAVNKELEARAKATAGDLKDYIEQYPAHEWLLSYWYENYDKLDIEYDAAHSQDTETARKSRLLTERHPGSEYRRTHRGQWRA